MPYLNKRNALTIVKLIGAHDRSVQNGDAPSASSLEVSSLRSVVEASLIDDECDSVCYGPCDDDDVKMKEEDCYDEETKDDVETEKESLCQEDEATYAREGKTCEHEEGDDGDDIQDDVEEVTKPDGSVAAKFLVGRTPVKAKLSKVKARLRFGYAGDGSCEIDVFHGNDFFPNILHVQRSSKALEIMTGAGLWRKFKVTKFPKDWTALLPCDKLLEVTFP